jgi:ribosomal protein S27AE
LVFGTDTRLAEAAKRKIIDASDVRAMQDCAARALARDDAATAEFWYMEVVTADSATDNEIAASAFDYCHLVLEPAGRYAEAELQHHLIEHLADASAKSPLDAERVAFEQRRDATGYVRQGYTEDWLSIPGNCPTSTAPARTQYLWAIQAAELNFQKYDQQLAVLLDPLDPQYRSNLMGYVIGVRRSFAAIDTECGMQGLVDWLANRQLAHRTGAVPGMEVLARGDEQVRVGLGAKAEALFLAVLRSLVASEELKRSVAISYAGGVLTAAGRHGEAELYYREALVGMATESTDYEQVEDELTRIGALRSGSRAPRLSLSDDWDVELPRTKEFDRQRWYNGQIRQLTGRAATFGEIADTTNKQRWALVARVVEALRSNSDSEVEFDCRLQALVDWLRLQRGQPPTGPSWVRTPGRSGDERTQHQLVTMDAELARSKAGKFCPQCGTRMPERTTKFCGRCGTSLEQVGSTPARAAESRSPIRQAPPAQPTNASTQLTHRPRYSTKGITAAAVAVTVLAIAVWGSFSLPVRQPPVATPRPPAATPVVPTPVAPTPAKSSVAPSSKPAKTVTDICKGKREDASDGDILNVQLTHNPGKGTLRATFKLAEPMPTYGDDAALVIITASADRTRSFQFLVEWLNGELIGRSIADVTNLQFTELSSGGVHIDGATIKATFPDDAVYEMGSGWGWMAATSMNGTDLDGCPSSEYEFQKFKARK